MKTLREKMSVTKLVLLLLVLALIFVEILTVIRGGQSEQLFNDVVLTVIAYYFAQKGIKYENSDTIIKEIKEEKREE